MLWFIDMSDFIFWILVFSYSTLKIALGDSAVLAFRSKSVLYKLSNPTLLFDVINDYQFLERRRCFLACATSSWLLNSISGITLIILIPILHYFCMNALSHPQTWFCRSSRNLRVIFFDYQYFQIIIFVIDFYRTFCRKNTTKTFICK